jgi:hypothetical protein
LYSIPAPGEFRLHDDIARQPKTRHNHHYAPRSRAHKQPNPKRVVAPPPSGTQSYGVA